MPVLSVRCVVTEHDGHKALSRRDAWITGHDFRSLALAAAAQLRVPPERCEYKLFSPDVGRAFVGVLLEVLHEGLSALVGPMAGPAVPPSLADEQSCSLEELIAQTGFGANGEGRGIYPVTVTYAGLLGHAAGPLAREPRESDLGYRTRCATASRARLERSRHEGFHTIRYSVPAADWQARDLEALLGLVDALLPAPEPRWRESGTITQETESMEGVPGPDAARSRPTRYALEMARGDFVAHLRLPGFPVHALVEWLSSRRCEINLCHPIRRAPTASPTHSNVQEMSDAR
jgi:hypothetical protein